MRTAAAALVAVLCSATPARHAEAADHAHPERGTDTRTLRAPWAFRLPSLDGSRFVQSSDLRGPLLVNFWSTDCPPCVAELPRLQAFAATHPDWTVVLVATDPVAPTREFVTRMNLRLQVLRPGANVVALMRSAGNRHGALPFSLALVDGLVCERQIGALSDEDLAAWSAACSPA